LQVTEIKTVLCLLRQEDAEQVFGDSLKCSVQKVCLLPSKKTNRNECFLIPDSGGTQLTVHIKDTPLQLSKKYQKSTQFELSCSLSNGATAQLRLSVLNSNQTTPVGVHFVEMQGNPQCSSYKSSTAEYTFTLTNTHTIPVFVTYPATSRAKHFNSAVQKHKCYIDFLIFSINIINLTSGDSQFTPKKFSLEPISVKTIVKAKKCAWTTANGKDISVIYFTGANFVHTGILKQYSTQINKMVESLR
jgi:hypothetical protein